MSDDVHLPDNDPRIRVSKLIADRGVASRRAAEQLMRDGLVTVDGEVVTALGSKVDPEQSEVRVEGKRLPPQPKLVYYVLYKPKGVITGPDEEKDRPSVTNMIEALNLKVDPVGRLDFNTEGAVLLTNDGDLANRLTHPSAQVPKRYVAKVYRTPSPSDLKAIERGVVGPETRFRPAKARLVEQTDKENAWLEVTVTESGQRVVQRMLAQLGHPVSKLRRESFATISIRGMERGQVRPLTVEEVARLRDIATGVAPKRAGKAWRGAGFAKPKEKPQRGPKRRPKVVARVETKPSGVPAGKAGAKSGAKPRTKRK